MISTVDLNSTQEDDWDHPLLKPYERREFALDEDTYSEGDEIEQQAVEIWRNAVHEHPQLAGPYLRLASALRDCERQVEAAEILRAGINQGFPQLLTDLVHDYPDLITEEELDAALARPENVEAAFIAFVAQRRLAQAANALSRLTNLRHKGNANTHFPFYEVCRLIGFLIEDDRLSEARDIQQGLAQLSDRELHLPPHYAMLAEIIEAETWTRAELRLSLCHLLFSNDASMLEEVTSSYDKRERRQLFERMSVSCPALVAAHRSALRPLDRISLAHQKPLAILVASSLLAASAVGWLLWMY